MNIRIPIPKWVIDATKVWMDFVNVPIATFARWPIVRLDVIMAILFVGIVGYYWHSYNWITAVQGGGMFLFVAYCTRIFAPR